MTRPIEKISNDLFQKLRARFSPVTLGSDDAESTTDPGKARFYNFVYKDADVPLGPITISLVDNRSLKVFYGADIVEQLKDKQNWFAFLRELRNFAKRNMLSFDARDLAKNQLNKQDFDFIRKTDGKMDHTDVEVTESVMFGSARKSYQTMENVKMIVNHRKSVDETIPGARSRYIESIFIENASGERFKFPYNYLTGARAMAQHVAEGGNPYDGIGSNILTMIKEMKDLSKFARKTKKFAMEDESANDVRTKVIERFQGLKHTLSSIGNQRGYKMFAENFKPEEAGEADDLTPLKERFTRQVFDTQMEDLLPAVQRAIKFSENKQIDEDQGAAIARFLSEPLVLKKDDAADALFRSTKFTDGLGLLSFIMSDIASRAIGKDVDALANFASHTAEMVHDHGFPDADKQIAMRFAKKYMDDIKKMAADPEYKDTVRQDPANIYGAKKTFDKPRKSNKVKEANQFAEWAGVDESSFYRDGERTGSAEGAKNAILWRIQRQHMDLVERYGLDKVLQMVDDEAMYLDNLEEIGSSDISAWVNNIKRNLAADYPELASDEDKKKVGEAFLGGEKRRGQENPNNILSAVKKNSGKRATDAYDKYIGKWKGQVMHPNGANPKKLNRIDHAIDAAYKVGAVDKNRMFKNTTNTSSNTAIANKIAGNDPIEKDITDPRDMRFIALPDERKDRQLALAERDMAEATLGGDKYAGKSNPNNKTSFIKRAMGYNKADKANRATVDHTDQRTRADYALNHPEAPIWNNMQNPKHVSKRHQQALNAAGRLSETTLTENWDDKDHYRFEDFKNALEAKGYQIQGVMHWGYSDYRSSGDDAPHAELTVIDPKGVKRSVYWPKGSKQKYFSEQQVDEKAKWRANPNAVAWKDDPNEPDSYHDDYYGYENPRSTGLMKAKGDVGKDKLDRWVEKRVKQPGKPTKAGANFLKGDIKDKHGKYPKPNLPEGQLDELSPELADRAADAADKKGRNLASKYMNWSNRSNKDKKFRRELGKQHDKAIDQQLKFRDYADNKRMDSKSAKFEEEKVDEVLDTKGKFLKYTLDAMQQIHNFDPYRDDDSAADRVRKRVRGLQTINNKIEKQQAARNAQKVDEISGKGDLEKIRDFHRNKQQNLAGRALNHSDEVDKSVRRGLGAPGEYDKYRDAKAKSANVVQRASGHGASANRADKMIKQRDKKKVSEMDSWPPGAMSDEHAGRIIKARDAEHKAFKDKQKADSVANAKAKRKERETEPYLPFGKNQLPHKKVKEATTTGTVGTTGTTRSANPNSVANQNPQQDKAKQFQAAKNISRVAQAAGINTPPNVIDQAMTASTQGKPMNRNAMTTIGGLGNTIMQAAGSDPQKAAALTAMMKKMVKEGHEATVRKMLREFTPMGGSVPGRNLQNKTVATPAPSKTTSPSANTAIGGLTATDAQRAANYSTNNVRDTAYGKNPTAQKLGPASSTGAAGPSPIPTSTTVQPKPAGGVVKSPMAGQGTSALPKSPMSGQGTSPAMPKTTSLPGGQANSTTNFGQAAALAKTPSAQANKIGSGTTSASGLPPTANTPVPPSSYKVAKGDNLSTLAKNWGVSVADIMKANQGIKDPNKIGIGQQLVKPNATGNSIYQGGIGTKSGPKSSQNLFKK